MAEGLLRYDAGDRFDVFSAGLKPTRVRPEAVAVMNELGIDISGQWSKSIEGYRNSTFEYVITVCDNANETCPVFPATTRRIHQSFQDPAALEGSEDERLAMFRRVRDQLRAYLSRFSSES